MGCTFGIKAFVDYLQAAHPRYSHLYLYFVLELLWMVKFEDVGIFKYNIPLFELRHGCEPESPDSQPSHKRAQREWT
jgi:hypothetical protein